MNQPRPIKPRLSLVERAAAKFDLNAAVQGSWPAQLAPLHEATRVFPPANEPGDKPSSTLSYGGDEALLSAPISAPDDEIVADPIKSAASRTNALVPTPPAPSRFGTVDREGLLAAGYILPDAPVTALAEEFRIIKRQLLKGVSDHRTVAPGKHQTILVCSARPDEGKTFCALNLALSLAAEHDTEVLLVDGDVAKPEVLTLLGLPDGPGLVDAIRDPKADVNDYVIATDLPGLSVLPAGPRSNDITELLASERTRTVLSDLTRRHPRRIVVIDSPPALMASPASVLAGHVGQIVLIVRADETTEADLKDAVALLAGCDQISLMLNGAGAAATGRRFGYYGYDG